MFDKIVFTFTEDERIKWIRFVYTLNTFNPRSHVYKYLLLYIPIPTDIFAISLA